MGMPAPGDLYPLRLELDEIPRDFCTGSQLAQDYIELEGCVSSSTPSEESNFVLQGNESHGLAG